MTTPYGAFDGTSIDIAAPFERALDVARHGQIAWLTEHDHRSFAVLPAEVAARALALLAGDQETIEILATPDELAAIKDGTAEIDRGEGIPFEDAFPDFVARKRAGESGS